MTEERAKEYFKWFEEREWKEEDQMELSTGAKIINMKKFIEAHLPIAKANWRKRIYAPYIWRLDQVKKHYEKLGA